MLTDVTKGVQYLNEIKDSCIAAFQWATKVLPPRLQRLASRLRPTVQSDPAVFSPAQGRCTAQACR